MVADIVTHSIAFLLGAATGAAASYLGNKYTDRRRHLEARAREEKQFRQVVEQMPELMTEIQKDLGDPEHQFIREFFVSKKSYRLKTGGPSFVYYEMIMLLFEPRFTFWRILGMSLTLPLATHRNTA